MNKLMTLTLLAFFCCLPTFSQEIKSSTKAFIVSQLKEFSATLDAVMSLSPSDAEDAESLDVLYGWDSFNFNGKKYESISNWVRKYYKRQLKGVELSHTLDVRLPSIRKKTQSEKDHRYLVDVTLHRESAIVSSNKKHDYMLADQKVTLTVIAREGHDLKILAIDGNWDFNPAYPYLSGHYHLALDEYSSNMSARGGYKTIQVESAIVYDKVYKGGTVLGTVKDFQKEDVTYFTRSSLTLNKQGNKLTATVPVNRSRKEKTHSIYVYQKNADNSVGLSRYHSIIQAGNKHRSVFDVETDYLPTWTFSMNYGTHKTIGFSIAGRFKNSPVTLGFHFAPSTTRWEHLYDEFQETMAASYGVNILQETEETEDYSIKTVWSDFSRPGKRDYSPEWDPDSTAMHKQALSYVFIQPGIYITEWMRFDLGFGFQRLQDTYLKENLPEKVTKEYTPLRPDVPAKSTETVYENSGRTFFFKDRAKVEIAIRYGLMFDIPVGKRKALLLGTGITLADLTNWDFSLGFAWGI